MPSAIVFSAFDVFLMFFIENAFYGLFKFTKNDPSFVQFLKFEQAET